jgi:transposase-like protein
MPDKQAMGIIGFLEKYKDEESCRELLFKKRFPEGFKCPRCASQSYGVHAPRNLYQCKECRYQCSVTAGTIMHKTRISLRKWFLAMYLMSKDKRGCSAMQLSKELPVTYKSAWFLVQRLRTAMGKRDSKYVLSGIVEVDDTYFGGSGKGGKRGRGTSKSKVLVGISKDEKGKPKFLKMRVVPNLRAKTIQSFAADSILEDSLIQTDAYRSYRKLSADKFKHEYKVFDPNSKWLHWLHMMIGNAKSFVNGTYHGLKKKHLQLYLNEFCYRFNRRYFKDSIFDRFVVAAVDAGYLKYAELKG